MINDNVVLFVCFVCVCVSVWLPQSNQGFAKYHPEKNALVWTIKSFPVRVTIVKHREEKEICGMSGLL